MLLFFFISESLGSAVPDSTNSPGTHQSDRGVLWHPRLHKPLEQLVLHTVSLQSLLDWLFKPKGPTLVEASVAVVPDKALAIAVTKRMLYEEKPSSGSGPGVQTALYFHSAV